MRKHCYQTINSREQRHKRKSKTKQRNRTEERNIKIRNTFSVLQEDDQEPILEEEKLLPITKMDKEKKKEIEGRKRGKLRKYLNEKRKIKRVPKPVLLKTHQ